MQDITSSHLEGGAEEENMMTGVAMEESNQKVTHEASFPGFIS